jgi:hypothetical protein
MSFLPRLHLFLHQRLSLSVIDTNNLIYKLQTDAE